MKEIVRLKIKFLFYNMAIVTAVIGVTFFAAAAVVKSRSYRETDQILSQIAEGAGSRIIFDGASQVRVPHFSVIVTADGAMLLQEGNYNSFPDQAFLDEVILLGMDGRGETGFLPEYSLKYFREARPEGVFLAFADTSYSETMMESVWQYGAAAGFVVPLLRSVLFGMPPLFPTALSMAFELLTYGLVVGLLYSRSRWQCVRALYRCLVLAMVAGRAVWGVVQAVLLGLTGSAMTFQIFLAGALLNAIPGIIVQLILIPVVMLALNRTGLVPFKRAESRRA